MPTTSRTRNVLLVLLFVVAALLGLRALHQFGVFDREIDPVATDDEMRPTTPGIAEARREIDLYAGDSPRLARAHQLLASELEKNPDDPEGLLQLARLLIMNGDAPLEVLDRLHVVDPTYSEGYVLRGHVLTNLGRDSEAWDALQKARDLGSVSPWLALNSADLLSRQSLNQAAAEMCEPVIARYREHPETREKVLLAAYQCRRDWLVQQRRLDEVESDFRAQVAIAPDNAWMLQAYAQFLCVSRGRCDEALPVIERALANADFGYARQTKAAILYDQWARHVAGGTGDSAEAERLFAEAQDLMPSLDVAMARFGGKTDNAALVQSLVAEGVSPDAFDPENRMTALMSTACCGDAASVRVLVAAGADVNLVTPTGGTALMMAAKTDHVEVARALVDAGADMRSKPAAAWHIAADSQSHEVRKMIQEAFPDAM